MKIPFTYYLHGSKGSAWDFFRDLSDDMDLGLDKTALTDLQYSFYEVMLECELDTDTMQVTILSAE